MKTKYLWATWLVPYNQEEVMEANTVKTVRDQIIDRLGEGVVTVPCGEMFARNLWREFGLRHINRIQLQEQVDVLVKEGAITYQELRSSTRREDQGGVVRERSNVSRVRVYSLVKRRAATNAPRTLVTH